jgi:uncharacterized protein (TIGR02145 family)
MGLFNFFKNKKNTENEHVVQNLKTITDIDGNKYHIIKIGKQVWTVENLMVTKYNDGTKIPFVADYNKWGSLLTDAYCYYDNDDLNKDKYGLLYNWYAIKKGKLAPKGWHVPTDMEWAELEQFLIENDFNWDGSKKGNKIAKALAAQHSWESHSKIGTIGNDQTKNNISNFSALPGGYRNHNSSYCDIGLTSYWWSSTEDNTTDAWDRYLSFGYSDLNKSNDCRKSWGLSVRCVKD